MNRSKLWGVCVCALLVPTARAQTEPKTITAGTRLRVELENPVSTKSSRVGDGVEAKLIESVRIHNHVVLPEGTHLAGHVVEVNAHNRKEKARARLRLIFDTLTLPGGAAFHSDATIQALGLTFNVGPEGIVTQSRLASDFELKRGRRMWLRLGQDLLLAPVKTEAASGPSMPLKVETGKEGEPPKVASKKTEPRAAGPASGRQPRASDKKSRYSVRMGELLITATAVGSKPITGDEPGAEQPLRRHHFFIVHVKVKNVGKRFPCASLDAGLEVNPHYEYPPDAGQTKRLPEVDELLPGEETEGDYIFNVRTGVKPVVLILKSKDLRERRCREHPDWGTLWRSRGTARLPLGGLPSPENRKP